MAGAPREIPLLLAYAYAQQGRAMDSTLSLEAGWLVNKERPHLALSSAVHWVRTADRGELLDRFPEIEPQLSLPLGAYWRTARCVRLTGQASFWLACEPGRHVAPFWTKWGAHSGRKERTLIKHVGRNLSTVHRPDTRKRSVQAASP